MEDHLWMLVTRKLANEATEKELAELDLALKQNPAFHNSLKQLFDWWDGDKQQEEDHSVRLFDNILKRIKTTSTTQ
ncbi:hypothetical protein [Mucilaginibacter dorajii]|uniref:Uncharacterized protein n=1 Tax=Mucilaginibacter dorajii TaxID=692994 RepID=A0ABP7P4G8_9SPHI|nr:hypothetical protein [Mucilaginibacter dorajii]MCS3734428.1 hypothetical protein [Mucilaginibacter dorajii]